MEDVSFNCIRMDEDFAAVAPEAVLIQRHRDVGGVPWNRNGFGNHDPGRARDVAPVQMDHFDCLYPIDLELFVSDLAGELPMDKAVFRLKGALPYMFRYERKLRESPLTIDFGNTPLTVNDVLNHVVHQLGHRWQATALQGGVILYEEDRQYPSAQRTYRCVCITDRR